MASISATPQQANLFSEVLYKCAAVGLNYKTFNHLTESTLLSNQEHATRD